MRRPRSSVAAALLALVVPAVLAGPAPAGASGVTYISFEDLAAPCLFGEAEPLRGRYAAAKFKGPTATGGGAVLDQCAGFGVPARTGTRFLAFSSIAPLANGGSATAPETIKLPIRQKTVSLWVSQTGASLGTAVFTLRGRRDGKVVRTMSATTTGSDWIELKLSAAKGLDSVVLSAADPDGVWLVDDLTMTS